MTIAEQIREARRNAGFTQKELAEKLGTTPQNLSQYESGKRKPKQETIQKIAEVLGVPSYKLLDSETGEKMLMEFLKVEEAGEERIAYIINELRSPKELTQKQRSDLVNELKFLEDEVQQIAVERLRIYEYLANNKAIENDTADLLNIFYVLNANGRYKVIDHARDIERIPEYREDTTPEDV